MSDQDENATSSLDLRLVLFLCGLGISAVIEDVLNLYRCDLCVIVERFYIIYMHFPGDLFSSFPV